MGIREDKKLKKLKKQLLQAFKQAVRETAEEITYEVQLLYRNSIEFFYTDKVFWNGNGYTNTPSSYQRTDSTYFASDAAGLTEGFMPFNMDNNVNIFHDKDGFGYYGGIRVDAKNIKGNPYHQNKKYVFERTFAEGIHGVCRQDERTFNKKKKNKKKMYWYKKKLYKDPKHYYTYSPDDSTLIRILRYPKKTDPTPKVRMDKGYKSLLRTHPKHLRDVFDEKLTNNINKIK